MMCSPVKQCLYCYYAELAGFPLYFGIEIQGLFKDFQGPWSCIFKDAILDGSLSMNSITAIFNVCFCD